VFLFPLAAQRSTVPYPCGRLIPAPPFPSAMLPLMRTFGSSEKPFAPLRRAMQSITSDASPTMIPKPQFCSAMTRSTRSPSPDSWTPWPPMPTTRPFDTTTPLPEPE
jgi:hypothetical protein